MCGTALFHPFFLLISEAMAAEDDEDDVYEVDVSTATPPRKSSSAAAAAPAVRSSEPKRMGKSTNTLSQRTLSVSRGRPRVSKIAPRGPPPQLDAAAVNHQGEQQPRALPVSPPEVASPPPVVPLQVHPWPQLLSLFVLKEVLPGPVERYAFLCCSCKPKIVCIKADRSSRGNLRKHLHAKHPDQVAEFERITQGRKRTASEPPKDPFAAAKAVQVHNANNKKPATQRECNRKLMWTVVDALCAFSLVENRLFIEYIQSLQPNRKIPSRRTLMRLISVQYTRQKSDLKNFLMGIKHVATTTDCWSASHR